MRHEQHGQRDARPRVYCFLDTKVKHSNIPSRVRRYKRTPPDVGKKTHTRNVHT